jgi:hypothetical protein
MFLFKLLLLLLAVAAAVVVKTRGAVIQSGPNVVVLNVIVAKSGEVGGGVTQMQDQRALQARQQLECDPAHDSLGNAYGGERGQEVGGAQETLKSSRTLLFSFRF